MDAVDFLKERERMCKSFDRCVECKLHGKCSHIEFNFEFDKVEDAVSIVEKWSKEHPVKTNGDVLFDFVEEHFGSNYGCHSYRLGDSIRLYFPDGFLDEEYKGKELEQTEDKLSFEEARKLFSELCESKSCKKCIFYEKTLECGAGCKRWCFDHPKESQEILLNWQCGKQKEKPHKEDNNE